MTKPDSLFIHYDKGLRLLRWQWRGPMTTGQFQQAFYYLLEISDQQRIRRWLMDAADMPIVGIDEQAWLSETWLPRFARLAVSEIAIILPSSLYNQIVVETLLAEGRQYECGEIQFFSDPMGALDWLANSYERAVELNQDWEEQSRPEPGKYNPGLGETVSVAS
jgi:hypothetical protein